MSAITPLVHWNLQTLLVSTDHHSTFHNWPQSKVWILCRWSTDMFDLTIGGMVSCNIWLQFGRGSVTAWGKHERKPNPWVLSMDTACWKIICLGIFLLKQSYSADSFWTFPVVWFNNKDGSATQSVLILRWKGGKHLQFTSAKHKELFSFSGETAFL
jgi:hypothetical protein